MKRIFCLLIMMFLGAPVFADSSETVQLNKELKVISQKTQEENKEKFYKMDIDLPQLEGNTLSAKEKLFNKLVQDKAQTKIDQFKQYVNQDLVHANTLPDNLRQNTLHIDYDIDVINPNHKIIISVRLTAEGMLAGHAHPYHNLEVMTYNLSDGKLVTLKELFKRDQHYLKFIADYSRKELEKKLQDKWMIGEGTKPLAKNFQNWNLESDDLLITFNEYQVAPYYEGMKEVTIPYSAMKTILNPKGLINDCVNKSCGLKQVK